MWSGLETVWTGLLDWTTGLLDWTTGLWYYIAHARDVVSPHAVTASCQQGLKSIHSNCRDVYARDDPIVLEGTLPSCSKPWVKVESSPVKVLPGEYR